MDRGKGLGGSSSINFFVWHKPPAEDYNGLCFVLLLGLLSDVVSDVERLGNPGWNWEGMERVIRPIEG